MVQGFRSGFYTTSSQAKKQGRKQETTSQPSFISQPQSFSSQQPGIQQTEQKQASKTAHTETQISAEKPKKQMKSALHQEISEFNPSSQTSMEKLIKAVLNLQEEVRKLKKANEKLMESNEKLMENMSKQEEIDSRFMSQERELNAFWNISQNQNSQSQNQQQKQTELDFRFGKIEEKLSTLRKSKAKLELYKWKSKFKKSKKKKGNNQKSKRNVSAAEVYDITIGSVGNSNKNKDYWIQKKQRQKEADRIKRIFYNQNGSIYKIKMGKIISILQVKGRKIWRNPSSQSRQNWTSHNFLFNSREHELLSS